MIDCTQFCEVETHVVCQLNIKRWYRKIISASAGTSL